MNTSWFISDLHLGHGNALKWGAKRQDFTDITEHDEFVVESINSKVKSKDTLFVLGDVCYRGWESLKYVKEFNGERKVLVLGNHDTQPMGDYLAVGFNEIYAVYRHREFVLTHVPIHPSYGLNQGDRGWKYNVHGHLHGEEVPDDRYINVNVDIVGFEPVSLEQIRDLIRYRERSPWGAQLRK